MPHPGHAVAEVVSAMLDAMPVVIIDPRGCGNPPPVSARRWAARARRCGSVLIIRDTWPEPPDHEIMLEHRAWTGIGQGHGHLRRQDVKVLARGRGAAARPRHATLSITPINIS